MSEARRAVKILVVSDTHIPERATKVPEPVEEAIRAEAPYHIAIHAGDLVDERVLDWLRGFAPE